MQSSPLIGRKRNFLESQKDNIHSHFSASPANKRHKPHHRSSSVDINSNHNVNNNNNVNKSFISRNFANNSYSKSGPASFEFDDGNPKERGFQNHSEKFQQNSMKNRQKTIYEQRKLNRKRVLQENYQRASLKNKMKQPQYWEFNIFDQKNNINSNINDDDNKYNQNMFGSDDYDSDELMSEYPINDNYQNQANENMQYFATNNNPPNINNSNNGFNAYQQYQPQSQWNPPRPTRHNFIPKTCPNLHKYSSKFDRNRSYYNNDNDNNNNNNTAFDQGTNYHHTNNVNDFDRNQNNNNHHQQSDMNQNNNNHHQQSDLNQNNNHHQQQPDNSSNAQNVHHQMHENENDNDNDNDPMNNNMGNDMDNDQNEPYQSNSNVDDGEMEDMEDMEDMEESKMDYHEEQKIEEKENIPINNSIDNNNNNQNENVSRSINKERRKLEQEELVRRRGQQRIEEMKNEQIKQKNEDAMRNELRDKIHPKIIRKAHLVKNNPIALIKLFYPKTRLNSNASDKRKEVLKAFKRALANFHPDRTINKSIPEQIEAEEIFKLLSKEKENFENKYNGNSYNNNSHHNNNSYHRYNDFNNNNRHQRHGWF